MLKNLIPDYNYIVVYVAHLFPQIIIKLSFILVQFNQLLNTVKKKRVYWNCD